MTDLAIIGLVVVYAALGYWTGVIRRPVLPPYVTKPCARVAPDVGPTPTKRLYEFTVEAGIAM